MCAEKANIVPKDNQLFFLEHYKDICEMKGMIMMHGFESRSALKNAYELMFKANVTCAELE